MYDQSFVPVAGTDSFGNAFKPIKGNDIEFGVKKEWFGGRWVSSASVYQIKRENSLVTIPTPASNGQTYQEQLGETESKGFEIDINGEVVKGLNLILNYAYTDSKITQGITQRVLITKKQLATKLPIPTAILPMAG